jgi:hypothetical protein
MAQHCCAGVARGLRAYVERASALTLEMGTELVGCIGRQFAGWRRLSDCQDILLGSRILRAVY